jgi:hypothetical protein
MVTTTAASTSTAVLVVLQVLECMGERLLVLGKCGSHVNSTVKNLNFWSVFRVPSVLLP